LPQHRSTPTHQTAAPRLSRFNVSESPRVALLLDPLTLSLDPSFNLKVKWGNHAPALARELLGRGYTVRGFGAPPGVIPRSSEVEFEGSQASAWWSKLRTFNPDILVAYDALSGAAFRGARMARKLNATLVLVEAALPGGGSWLDRTLARVGEKLFGHYVRRTARAVPPCADPGPPGDSGAFRLEPGLSLAEARAAEVSRLCRKHAASALVGKLRHLWAALPQGRSS
jgi:hypothetical protein